MYSLVSGVYSEYLAPQQLNLLVVGAQGVGKTTLLERIKVTQFDRTKKVVLSTGATLPINIFRGDRLLEASTTRGAAPAATPTPKTTQSSPAARGSLQRRHTPRKLSAWVCPAPPKYANAAVDDDADDTVHSVLPLKNDTPQPVLPSPLDQRSLTGGSMESVELNGPTTTDVTTVVWPMTSSSTNTTTTTRLSLVSLPQYDLKPGVKMLPLLKIRPTIGMNLGKVNVCGTRCHVWDLGGRLQHLWRRYYDDCEAVIFVWKLGAEHGTDAVSDDDDDSDTPPPVTYDIQVQLLQQVRESIPDDVPFVVLCHSFGAASAPAGAFPNQRYQTAPHLLPHYHNPNTSLFLVNAATGSGIKAAMEWLIPVAKQQQRVRDRPPRGAGCLAMDDDDVVKP
jgi:GTPase SAR1 family protein